MAAFSKPLLDLLRHPKYRRPVFVLLAAILLLQPRILHLPRALKRLPVTLNQEFIAKLSQEEMEVALQQVYEKQEDDSKSLLVPYRNRVSKVRPSLSYTWLLIHKVFQVTIRPIPKSKFASDVHYFPPLTAAVKAKPNIDTAFLSQLRAILFRVAFPSFRSKETLIVFLHSVFLVMRTVLSVAVARLDGRIARDLVRPFYLGYLLISGNPNRLVPMARAFSKAWAYGSRSRFRVYTPTPW